MVNLCHQHFIRFDYPWFNDKKEKKKEQSKAHKIKIKKIKISTFEVTICISDVTGSHWQKQFCNYTTTAF